MAFWGASLRLMRVRVPQLHNQIARRRPGGPQSLSRKILSPQRVVNPSLPRIGENDSRQLFPASALDRLVENFYQRSPI